MRSLHQVEQVLFLISQGLSDSEISGLTSVPRSTVSGWRAKPAGSGQRRRNYGPSELPRAPYAYLLGLYLGDGCLAQTKRDVYRLRITLDAAYPSIIDECKAAVSAVMPDNAATIIPDPINHCACVSSYSKHWLNLFPQHGPGKKHLRPIILESWQEEIIEGNRRDFLRGLYQSDGSRYIARQVSRGKAYYYERYSFTNYSADILMLFIRACRALNIACTKECSHRVSINRRKDVALLDTFLGPKS